MGGPPETVFREDSRCGLRVLTGGKTRRFLCCQVRIEERDSNIISISISKAFLRRVDMKIDIICSEENHPVNAHLEVWIKQQEGKHDVTLRRNLNDVIGGDILFLISCTSIVPKSVRLAYRNSVLIHASDLPEGKGWSPHVWSIINGTNRIVVSLLNVSDPVDSGDIWTKREIQLFGTELYDEINRKLFSCEVELMTWFVQNYSTQHPIKQNGSESFCRRRYPEDSRLDVYTSIASQFDLLRVCDPDRFPAFFEFRGVKYTLRIERQKGGM